MPTNKIIKTLFKHLGRKEINEKDTSTTDKRLQAEALTRETMPSITHMCPPSLTRGNDVLDARQRKDYHSN